MNRFLLFLLILSAGALPLPAQQLRAPVAAGVPVELQGVSSDMAAASKIVVEKQWALSGDKTVSAPLADDLAFFLQQRYLQLGYRDARVDWKLSGTRAVLLVEEGTRQTVGRITFTGVDPERIDSLRSYLTRQTREREGRLAKTLPFVEGDLEAGLGLVVRRLQADGYLLATAADAVYTPGATPGSMDIAIDLKPGKLSVFSVLRVEGDASPLTKAAQEKITALAGQPYSEVRLENLRKDLKGDLQQQGRFAAEVQAVSLPGTQGDGKVPAVITIIPGEPFTVTEVRVADQLSKGAHHVAEAVFAAATGQTYAPETLDLLYRRSLDTGIFSRLEVEPVALSGHTLALSVSGEEALPRTLGFFGGYETFYGPIAGIEARHVNFMDTGNSLGLRAELRGTGANGSVQWADPAVFGSRNALGLGMAVENFTFKDYTHDSAGLRGSLTRRINRRITAELFSAVSLNTAESEVLTMDELGPDDYQTLTAGGRLILDYRDNPLNPRSGWLAGAAVEGGFDQGGENDINFLRTDFNASWYHPLGESWRFALGARASSLGTNGAVEDVPIDLRLFNGGGTTVRSFAEREMGAASSRGSTPLGGLATSVVNAELSYEIIPNLEVAAFADAGSVSREDPSLFRGDDLRYAVGMGIRYQLPIGPLRVDYGFNPDRQPGEAAGALHVTFGFAF